MELIGEILLEGRAEAPILLLGEPLSFWGGVDPASGRITQVRHPDCGRSVAGRLLALPGTIGSSSSSAVMLELLASGHAPAGLLLTQPDAILLLGIVVARELGYPTIPALKLPPEALAALPSGRPAVLTGSRLAVG